jgi:hypothetical protein
MNKYQKYRQTENGKITNRKASAKYDSTPEGKENKRLRQAKWAASHNGVATNRARAAINKINRLRRTLKLTKEEKDEIKEFYKNTPPGMEVDHDLPLQGKNVSGLHVIRNLQYLSPLDNKKKSNNELQRS